MHWLIPAKTFLLGEYVALAGGPAIVLTTSPCFKVIKTEVSGLQGIHPASLAGRLWLSTTHENAGLEWHDPYQGCGGLGASGAQFIGTYLATKSLEDQPASMHELFNLFQQGASQDKGVPSSGYDILAQSLNGCVYINRQQHLIQSHGWPFQDLAFLLLHTGQKLATHHHLQNLVSLDRLDELADIVQRGERAFITKNSQTLINAVNDYYQQLGRMHLVADHTKLQVEQLRQYPDILAIKGCGAMGADVLFVLAPIEKRTQLQGRLAKDGWKILASHENLYTAPALLPADLGKK